MGFMPKQFLLALQSLVLLGCSPLQFTQLGLFSVGCSSEEWSFDAHMRHLGCLQLAMQWENILHLLHWKTWVLSSYGEMVQFALKSWILLRLSRVFLSSLLARLITIDAKFLAWMYSSNPSHLGTLHCFIFLYSGTYVWSSSCTIVISMGVSFPHHVGTLLIFTLWCSVSRRIDRILFGVMIFVMSFPCTIRSDALQEWVVIILMFPAPE